MSCSGNRPRLARNSAQDNCLETLTRALRYQRVAVAEAGKRVELALVAPGAIHSADRFVFDWIGRQGSPVVYRLTPRSCCLGLLYFARVPALAGMRFGQILGARSHL